MLLAAYGDSINTGYGIPSSQGWVTQSAPVNYAVNGSQAADVSKLVQSQVFNTDQPYTIMVGVNDHRTYKLAKIDLFVKFLRQAVAWISLPEKITARSSSVSYTGAWTNTSVNSIGKVCTANGSKASTTVKGTSVFIGHIIQNHVNAQGVANVKIDGVSVGSINCFGSMNTVNGLSYAPACTSFHGLTDDLHTVELEITSPNGQYFYLDYIAGSDQTYNPKILVSNIIKMSDAAYIMHGTSQANVEAYNDEIENIISEFNNVVMVDNYSSITISDLQSDGVHPNFEGANKIKNNMAEALF